MSSLLARRRRTLLWSLLLFVSTPLGQIPAGAQTLEYSPDITVDLSGTTAADEDVVSDDLQGVVVPLSLGALPEAADVDGYQLLSRGDQLFSLASAAELPGPVPALPADVVRYDGLAYTLEFDALAEGIPDGVDVDAVGVNGSGDLVLSFDTTVDLGGGLVVADEDLVSFDGLAFTQVFDGSALGLPSSLDVDSVAIDGLGAFMVSFDATGTIGGWTFDDDTVMRWNGTVWTPLFETDFTHPVPGFEGGDIIALPEPGFALQFWASLFCLALLGRRRGRPPAGASSACAPRVP